MSELPQRVDCDLTPDILRWAECHRCSGPLMPIGSSPLVSLLVGDLASG